MIQWSVWKNCRLVGYVLSPSETGAIRQATEKFGKNIFLIRM